MSDHLPTANDHGHRRLPRLRTSGSGQHRSKDDREAVTGVSPSTASPRPPQGSPPNLMTTDPAGARQNFVLTDPLAFRYLEEDPSTKVLDRERELAGYECYVVEQWATSRSHPTFVVTTYTGDPKHVVIVGVLSVPTDEREWSPRLRIYFKALNHYHATRRQTELGVLMVTNLSSFPSALTVVLVPDGHVRKYRLNFTANENLKRLGCSGRVGLTVQAPAAATAAKFHHLYRTSDKNEIRSAVVELVRLCQTALTLFDKLDVNYADGLLCDVTERAINDWWLQIGHEHYNIEPHDGILGPTTVAGLLGLLLGARNRLHAASAPVGKDAFDASAMKKGIGHFQKQHKLLRTRRLDPITLRHLVKSTEKAAKHDGWLVPRAVKSTVAELSGKGGEMVMDVVGRKDRAGIAEIETCEIERFTQLAYGDEVKWLWQGKPIKTLRGSAAQQMTENGGPKLNLGLTFEPDKRSGGFTWTARKSTVDGMLPSQPMNTSTNTSAQETPEGTDEETSHHKSIFKRTSTLRSEAKSGLGKLKGAAGRIRGHHHRTSLDDSQSSATEDASVGRAKGKRPMFSRTHSSPLSTPANSPKYDLQNLDDSVRPNRHHNKGSIGSLHNRDGPIQSPHPYSPDNHRELRKLAHTVPETPRTSEEDRPTDRDDRADRNPGGPIEINSSDETRQSGEQDAFVVAEEIVSKENADHLLKRARSLNHLTVPDERPSLGAMPRQLSFSLAEEGVLTWPDFVEDDMGEDREDLSIQLAREELIARQAKDAAEAIEALQTTTMPWTDSQLQAVRELVEQYVERQGKLDVMFDERLETSNHLEAETERVIQEHRTRMADGNIEIETLVSKLEYEIDGLRSRIEEVEVGVDEYEKGVRRIEERVQELDRESSKPSRCVVQ